MTRRNLECFVNSGTVLSLAGTDVVRETSLFGDVSQVKHSFLGTVRFILRMEHSTDALAFDDKSVYKFAKFKI